MKGNISVDELVISYLFPPSKDVSGMVLAKRFMAEDKTFDVIQANIKDDCDYEFKRYVDKYINEQILIDIDCNPNFPDCIFDFVDKSMAQLDNRSTYKKIYTRVWKIANNFLALEYKLRHPEVFWTAEFSDPILYDIYNKRRDTGKNKDITDCKYLERINKAIENINAEENTDFKLLDNSSNVYVLVEYIAYLFADEIIFTNPHQREVMLNQFPVDIKDFALEKSEIKPHPILPIEFYHIKDYNENLDSSKINIGYFGNFYSKRHFEMVFDAFEVLNHKFKNKLFFNFYVNDKNFLKDLTKNLEISKNMQIRDTIDYLDFLNVTTKFDVLIINDLITSDCFDLNPYRPSKLSDYIGSGSDIWAICEKGSVLSNAPVKYKSFVDDYESNVDALVNILNDFSYNDDNYSVVNQEEYLQDRITNLNILIENNHKRLINRTNKNKKLERKIKKLENKIEHLEKENSDLHNTNQEILSSNSWKLTKNLRKVGNIVKK